MTDFTLVMAYFENKGMLARQYEHLKEFPSRVRRLMTVIIVDDCSPDNPAWGEDIGIELHVYRIGGEKVKWNQDAARNIGAHHADSTWLLLTDMDHMVPVKTAAYLAENRFDPRNAYKFLRVSEPKMDYYKEHPNSWFMTKALYDKIGGYDERFAGNYGTDGEFRGRIRDEGKVLILEVPIIRVPREVTPDASTTQFTRKSEVDSANIIRIKEERALEKGWRPKRLTFPYSQVWPACSQ